MLPGNSAQLTTDWFRNDAGVGAVTVAAVERVGADYGFAGESYRVRLRGDGPSTVVAKMWPVDSKASDREVFFYNELANATDIRLPRMYHGASDGERAILVLEDLGDVRQGDVLVAETVESLSRLAIVLGSLHGSWWDSRRLDGVPWLLDLTTSRRSHEWFDDRREQFLDRFGPLTDPVARRLFDRLEVADHIGWDLLRQVPATLLHVDFHLDNVVFVEHGAPVLLDWAMVGRGPAALDLAGLIFAMAEPQHWGALIDRYVSALGDAGVELAVDDIVEQLGAALLVTFATRTLGVAGWFPTVERGKAQVVPGIRRAERAVSDWYRIHPQVLDRALS